MRLAARFLPTNRKIGVACKTLAEFTAFVKKHFNLIDKDIVISDQNGNEILDNEYFQEIERDAVLDVAEKQVTKIIAKCKVTGRKVKLPKSTLEELLALAKDKLNLVEYDVTVYDSVG